MLILQITQGWYTGQFLSSNKMNSYFVLFGTLQQCAPMEPGGNRTRNLTVQIRCTTDARFRLEFSTSPINDILRELSSIASYVIRTYRGMVGSEIHDFPLDDQLIDDFIHPMSWLLKYFVSSRGFCQNFQLQIHHWSVKLEAENWLEHWTAVSFCLELFSSARKQSLMFQSDFGFQLHQ